MYNEVTTKLFQNFKARRNGGVINFINHNDKIVATLYSNEQVVNIFLSASRDVVWNHHNMAIFVLAKNYTVMTNTHCRKAEAAWLIGMCGATWEHNLKNHNMFLECGNHIGSMSKIESLGNCNPTDKENVVRFRLFDYEVTYSINEQENYSHIQHLNPALIYPVKHGGKKGSKESVTYLRREYYWEYNEGFETAGSYQTREFIKSIAPKQNHTEFSKISYMKVFK